MRYKGNPADALRALAAERARVKSADSAARQKLTAAQMAADDRGTVLHEQYLATTQNSRDHETLAQIEAAMARLERGEYGICLECNGEISAKRLQALPWALRCVRCQERFETAFGVALCA